MKGIVSFIPSVLKEHPHQQELGVLLLSAMLVGFTNTCFCVQESTVEFDSALKKNEVHVLVVQWCPTLCCLMDCNLPGSSVHGILLARILEFLLGKFQRVGQD
jgi:hypothetical protein